MNYNYISHILILLVTTFILNKIIIYYTILYNLNYLYFNQAFFILFKLNKIYIKNILK